MDLGDTVWLGVFIAHLPTLALPVVYHLHRHLDPIKVRRPRLLTCLCVVCVLWNLEQQGQCALGAYVPAGVEEVAAATLMMLAIEGFFIFALSLYVAFSRTRRQLGLAGQPISVSGRNSQGSGLASARRAIRTANVLRSDRFAAYWLAGHLLFQLAYQGVFLYLHPALFSISKKESLADEFGNGMALFQLLNMGRCVPTLIAIVIVGVRLRIVVDAFGTKQMLKRAGRLVLVCVLLFMALQGAGITHWRMPYVSNLLTGDAVLWIVFAQPILQARSRPPRANTARFRSQFERFLSTPEGYSAFQKHLEREFAVENLLFWHDVQEFQAMFAKSEPAAQLAKVRRLYDRYLHPDAPLEVNLPAEIVQALLIVPLTEESLETGRLHRNLFAAAAAELLRLLEVNSLHRFVAANGRLWTDFLMREEEGHVFDSLNRASMTTNAVVVAGAPSANAAVFVKM